MIKNGQFKIDLGLGKRKYNSKYKTLKDVFFNHDTLKMAFSINRQNYYPLVKIKPAGHSMRSIQAIAGVSDDSYIHSKTYDRISKNSAIQAVVLSANKHSMWYR